VATEKKPRALCSVHSGGERGDQRRQVTRKHGAVLDRFDRRRDRAAGFMAEHHDLALRAEPSERQDEAGDLLSNATGRNVMLNLEKLKTAAPILKSLVDDRKVRVVGGIYQLKSGRVRLLT